MTYDYSSNNKRLELPNPYRVENGFLFLSAAIAMVGGGLALVKAREILKIDRIHGIVELLVATALLGVAVSLAVRAARRLRFFFGRGRPMSLAPEINVGATGDSVFANGLKAMLRQGALEYPEPQGALNGLLYNWVPRLITAPQRIQTMAQTHFFNWLSLSVTLASFIVGWGVLGTEESRPLVAAGYLLFAVLILLRPLSSGDKAQMSKAFLVGLIVVAVVGPVLVGLLGQNIPRWRWELQGQTIFLLISALVAVGLILYALRAQLTEPPATERSVEMSSLSMNGPPGALLVELDRRLQSGWTEGIPNRRYTRIEPDTRSAHGSGNFAGEMMEESQPMPQGGFVAPTLHSALAAPTHRGLVLLDAFATVLVASGTILALRFASSFDASLDLTSQHDARAGVGYSLISFLIAAFCFQSAGAIWGRFNFESVIVWVEMLGNFQTSRIGTGNQFSSQLRSDSEIVRVESMTLRIWRARLESVVFGKDEARTVTAMFGTAGEARQLADVLTQFARDQSVFVAPGTGEDLQRLDRLRLGEQLLTGGAAPHAQVSNSAAREGIQTTAADRKPPEEVPAANPRAPTLVCHSCQALAPADARFCNRCGSALSA